ncbi:MAG: hypothetical protein LBC87_07105 [Fibromonadaceae bacterium]|jgi:hypothetical protein|nr:hypothetical protein [Fibromonadaceae bacterium]
MEKYKFIDLFNKELNGSCLFSSGGTELCHAFKYFFDEEKNIDEILSKISALHTNEQINLKNEEDILNKVLNLTKDNIDEMTNSWFSESEKNKSKGYLAISPYRDSELQLGLTCLLLLSIRENRIENEKKLLLSPIETPEEIIDYRDADEDLIIIDDFEILETAYRKKDIVIYPDFNQEIIEKLKLLDPTKSSIKIRPHRYGNFSEYSKLKNIFEERTFGVPFKKEKFQNIFSKKYGKYEYFFNEEENILVAQGFYIPLDKLEYVIKPYEDNLISLSLEETIDINKSNYTLLTDCYFIDRNGSRFLKHKYLHMIMNKDTAEINHLDFSYLYYKDDKIEQRKTQHIKDKVVSADYKKKLLRIDSKNPKECFTEFELFTDIARLLMDENKNPEICNFFNGI